MKQTIRSRWMFSIHRSTCKVSTWYSTLRPSNTTLLLTLRSNSKFRNTHLMVTKWDLTSRTSKICIPNQQEYRRIWCKDQIPLRVRTATRPQDKNSTPLTCLINIVIPSHQPSTHSTARSLPSNTRQCRPKESTQTNFTRHPSLTTPPQMGPEVCMASSSSAMTLCTSTRTRMAHCFTTSSMQAISYSILTTVN